MLHRFILSLRAYLSVGVSGINDHQNGPDVGLRRRDLRDDWWFGSARGQMRKIAAGWLI
jgi:hypothetical protein